MHGIKQQTFQTDGIDFLFELLDFNALPLSHYLHRIQPCATVSDGLIFTELHKVIPGAVIFRTFLNL